MGHRRVFGGGAEKWGTIPMLTRSFLLYRIFAVYLWYSLFRILCPNSYNSHLSEGSISHRKVPCLPLFGAAPSPLLPHCFALCGRSTARRLRRLAYWTRTHSVYEDAPSVSVCVFVCFRPSQTKGTPVKRDERKWETSRHGHGCAVDSPQRGASVCMHLKPHRGDASPTPRPPPYPCHGIHASLWSFHRLRLPPLPSATRGGRDHTPQSIRARHHYLHGPHRSTSTVLQL